MLKACILEQETNFLPAPITKGTGLRGMSLHLPCTQCRDSIVRSRHTVPA